MHNYKLLVYNFCMKKLLTLLLLSPVLAADLVNLKCERYAIFDPATATRTDVSELFSITIDSDAKQATTKDGTFGYTEKGNQVRWDEIYVRNIGDVLAFADKFFLDRLTGELEKHFLTWKFPDGIQVEDLTKLSDTNNYELGLVHYASCKKTESLF